MRLTRVHRAAQLDRPLYDVANENQPVAVQRVGFFVRAQRTRNYVRCDVPPQPTPCTRPA